MLGNVQLLNVDSSKTLPVSHAVNLTKYNYQFGEGPIGACNRFGWDVQMWHVLLSHPPLQALNERRCHEHKATQALNERRCGQHTATQTLNERRGGKHIATQALNERKRGQHTATQGLNERRRGEHTAIPRHWAREGVLWWTHSYPGTEKVFLVVVVVVIQKSWMCFWWDACDVLMFFFVPYMDTCSIYI